MTNEPLEPWGLEEPWPLPQCDICDITWDEVEWCGECGCCSTHCQEWPSCDYAPTLPMRLHVALPPTTLLHPGVFPNGIGLGSYLMGSWVDWSIPYPYDSLVGVEGWDRKHLVVLLPSARQEVIADALREIDRRYGIDFDAPHLAVRITSKESPSVRFDQTRPVAASLLPDRKG